MGASPFMDTIWHFAMVDSLVFRGLVLLQQGGSECIPLQTPTQWRGLQGLYQALGLQAA